MHPPTTSPAAAPRVIRADELSESTAQTADAVRRAAISRDTTGATGIWLGKVSTGPGHRSSAHHHGVAETAGYVLKGHAYILFGNNYEKRVDLAEGDFVFVPPFMPHIEGNASDDTELVWLTARHPDNIVVNLE
jgi:uncharacterized RmlC-like cupin family protein